MTLLFKAVDYCAALLMGSATLLMVLLVVGEGWNMFLAMFVAMLLGMVVLFAVVLLFSPLSTPFELFPPGMIITMVVGMAAGMAASHGPVNWRTAWVAVLIFSVVVQFVIDCYNAKLKGEVPLER